MSENININVKNLVCQQKNVTTAMEFFPNNGNDTKKSCIPRQWGEQTGSEFFLSQLFWNTRLAHLLLSLRSRSLFLCCADCIVLPGVSPSLVPHSQSFHLTGKIDATHCKIEDVYDVSSYLCFARTYEAYSTSGFDCMLKQLVHRHYEGILPLVFVEVD